MTRGAGVFATCVAVAIVSLSACAGGGKQARRIPPLAPCPKQYPFLTDANYGRSTQRTLVSFDADTARVCRYGPGSIRSIGRNNIALVGSAILDEQATKPFEELTNELKPIPAGTDRPPCNSITRNMFYVTFRGATGRIDLTEFGCGYVGDDSVYTRTTSQWRTRVEKLTTGLRTGS